MQFSVCFWRYKASSKYWKNSFKLSLLAYRQIRISFKIISYFDIFNVFESDKNKTNSSLIKLYQGRNFTLHFFFVLYIVIRRKLEVKHSIYQHGEFIDRFNPVKNCQIACFVTYYQSYTYLHSKFVLFALLIRLLIIPPACTNFGYNTIFWKKFTLPLYWGICYSVRKLKCDIQQWTFNCKIAHTWSTSNHPMSNQSLTQIYIKTLQESNTSLLILFTSSGELALPFVRLPM